MCFFFIYKKTKAELNWTLSRNSKIGSRLLLSFLKIGLLVRFYHLGS